MDFRIDNANTNLQTNPTDSNAGRLARKSSLAILRLKGLIGELDAQILNAQSNNYFEAMNLMEQKALLQKELQRLQPVQMPIEVPKPISTLAPLAESLSIKIIRSESLDHLPVEADIADLQEALFSIRGIRQEIAETFLHFFSETHIEGQANMLLEVQRAIDTNVPQDLILDLLEQGISFSHHSGYYNWMQLDGIDKLQMLTIAEMKTLVDAAGSNTDYHNLKTLFKSSCSLYFDIAACTEGFLNDAGIRNPFANCFSEIASKLIKDSGTDANDFFGSDGKLLPWKVGEFLRGKEENIVSEYLEIYKMQADVCKYLSLNSISALMRSKPKETAASAQRQAPPAAAQAPKQIQTAAAQAPKQAQPATASKPAASTASEPRQAAAQAAIPAENKKAGAELVSLSGSKTAIERAGISPEAVQTLLSVGFRWGNSFYTDNKLTTIEHITSTAAGKNKELKKVLTNVLNTLSTKGIVIVSGAKAALNTKNESIVDADFTRLFEEVKLFIELQSKR